MTQVLILDGRQRSALAAVRSLGRRGVQVAVADSSLRTLAATSRHAARGLLCPDAARQPEAFVEWVAGTAAKLQLQAVLPLTDLSIMLLTPARARMGSTSLLCAPVAPYEQVSDKAELVKLAGSCGLRVPATSFVTSLEELADVLDRSNYPLVLKPARSKILLEGQVISTAVQIAGSREAALRYAGDQPWLGSMPLLVQEFIPGHGAGVFAFFWQGHPHAWFAHRRLREKPPAGGVSVLSESVTPDVGLVKASEELLSRAGWNGPAMVEFRIASNGDPYLMEINGRLWGSVQLAIDCGVDFPWMLYSAHVRGTVPPATTYPAGRRLRWTLGDLDNLLIQLRGSTGTGRWSAMRGFLGSFFDSHARSEILRWSDPAPALRELGNWVQGRP